MIRNLFCRYVICVVILAIAFSSAAIAQNDSQNYQNQAFKWFPEGNYSGLSLLDLSAVKDRAELELFSKYWLPYRSFDPYDNFLPAPLNQYKVKAFGNAARFKVGRLTSKGLEKLRGKLNRGGDVNEFGGEHYFIRNNGFEITVCLYDDPQPLIARALADDQIMLEPETLFGLKVYRTTPKGAKLRRQVVFAATGTGEIVIADNTAVLEAMLEAGMGSENLSEDKSYNYLWEKTSELGVFWMFDDVTASAKVKLALALEAGDEKKVKQYQGYLDKANNQNLRYFQLKNGQLRRGYLYIFPTEARAGEVYLKYKEWEGVNPEDYNPRERDQNWHLMPLGTKHILDGRIYHQYLDLDAAAIQKRIDDAGKRYGTTSDKKTK